MNRRIKITAEDQPVTIYIERPGWSARARWFVIDCDPTHLITAKISECPEEISEENAAPPARFPANGYQVRVTGPATELRAATGQRPRRRSGVQPKNPCGLCGHGLSRHLESEPRVCRNPGCDCSGFIVTVR